jgi:cytochrome c-type biogenesis protein CcmH
MNIRNGILLVGLLLLPLLTPAGTEMFDFSGNVEKQRYMDLISQLRCLVCQNQSLADSDAELAHDLRVEVYEHMEQGKSDEEVVDFLVSRYGDFVLYNPPVKPSTYLLWYGPFVLLALGLLLLVKNIRQRDRQRRTEAELSQDEQARLDALLGERNEKETRS